MTLAIEVSSPLNGLTKLGPAGESAESNSEQNTRSNPVCLEIAVTIRSLPGEKGEASAGPAQPTREEARTVIVFDNGAVLRLASHFPAGQTVILSNHEGRDGVCRVVSTRDVPTVKGYIEVEFLEPIADFWGIHKPEGQSNVLAPPAVGVAPPPVVTHPQVGPGEPRSEEHTSELQSRRDLVCRLLLEKKKKIIYLQIDVKKTKKKNKQ